jgi:hypothetical protein
MCSFDLIWFFFNFFKFFFKVTILRKYDPKNYKQLLFGFLTKYVGSSFELETFEEKNQHHARLTVYGDGIFSFHHKVKNEAEKIVVSNYINSLCVEKFRTW